MKAWLSRFAQSSPAKNLASSASAGGFWRHSSARSLADRLCRRLPRALGVSIIPPYQTISPIGLYPSRGFVA